MSDQNEVRDQHEDGAYSEDEEEHNILQARWLKLVKARHKDDELARKRSDENGRYTMFVCCQKGKRRKAVAHDDLLGCDGCFGWLHRECLTENWDEVEAQDFFFCNFCRHAKARESASTRKTQQATSASVPIVEPQTDSGFQVNHEDEVSVELDDSNANQEVAKWSEGDEITGMNRVSGQKFQNEYQEFDRPLGVTVAQTSTERQRSLGRGLICTSCGQNDVLSAIFTCSCGRNVHEACAYPLDLFLPADKELKCAACQKRSGTLASFADHSAQSVGFPQRASTPIEPTTSCPCGKQVKTSMISCVKCSRIWHMPCVRRELLFGSELICELCKSDDSLEERRRLAAPFLQAEERFSQAVAPTAIKTNTAPRPPDKISAADKGRREFLCNICHQPEMRAKDFTKLGCCKGCCRMLHSYCSGLASVECLEWEECADCQHRMRVRGGCEPPQRTDDVREPQGTDENRVRFSVSGLPRGLNNLTRTSDLSESHKQRMHAGFTSASNEPRKIAENRAVLSVPSETPQAFQNAHLPHNTGLDLTWVEDMRRELKELKDRLDSAPAIRLAPADQFEAPHGRHAFVQNEQFRALPLPQHNAPPSVHSPRDTHGMPSYYGHNFRPPISCHPVESEETLKLRRRVNELEAALKRESRPEPGSRDHSDLISALPKVPQNIPANCEKLVSRNDDASEEAKLVKLLADALGGNRIGNSLNNIKFLDGSEGPEQVRRWFHEFELITRGWRNEERREALQVRVKGRAATAVQLMPRDLLNDYEKIKRELLLRLADDDHRRSVNLTSLLSGCPRLPNESVEQFGARVQDLVRNALEPNCPLSQVDAIAKECFTQGLDDEQLMPSLLDQRENKEFRYLVDHAVHLRRSFDLHAAKRSATSSLVAPTTNKGNRQHGGPSYNAKWIPHAQGTGYTNNAPPQGTNQQKNVGQANSTGHSQNSQPWMKPAQGQFRFAPGVKSNNVSTTPHNANAVQTAEMPAKIGILTQHPSTYDPSATLDAQTHYSISAALPVGPLTEPAVGPCAIGPVPKKNILVESMPAVSLLDSGAPMSIAEAGYLEGLLQAKGIDPSTWPIDPPSTAISVANGDPLNCIGSTILQVSIGSDAKPVRVQLTRDNLSYPVIIGTNAFADLGIQLVNVKSGASVLESEPLNLLSADFSEPPDKFEKAELSDCESSTASEKPCTKSPNRMYIARTRAKRKKKPHIRFADPEVQPSMRAREEGDCAQRKKEKRVALENSRENGQYGKKLPEKPPLVSDDKGLDASKGLNAFRVDTVFGQHWLRNVPRAHATFPLRPPDLLQLGSAGNAVNPSVQQLCDFVPLWHEERSKIKTGLPGETFGGSVPVDTSTSDVFPETDITIYLQPETQPSTSASFINANPHSTRDRRITRRNARSRSSHDIDSHPLNEPFSAASRSGLRSNHDIDSHLLNEPFSVLMPSGQPSSKFNSTSQKLN